MDVNQTNRQSNYLGKIQAANVKKKIQNEKQYQSEIRSKSTLGHHPKHVFQTFDNKNKNLSLRKMPSNEEAFLMSPSDSMDQHPMNIGFS